MTIDLAALLARYRHFEECLLTGLHLNHFFERVVLTFNVVWDEHGRLRKDLDTRERRVDLVLDGVRDLHYRNALTPEQRAHVNWSASEVALVKVDPGGTRVSIEWESDHHALVVTCASTRIVEHDP